MIVIETDVMKGIDGYAWWEVAIAEVSTMPSVRDAYAAYVENKKRQRYHL